MPFTYPIDAERNLVTIEARGSEAREWLGLEEE